MSKLDRRSATTAVRLELRRQLRRLRDQGKVRLMIHPDALSPTRLIVFVQRLVQRRPGASLP